MRTINKNKILAITRILFKDRGKIKYNCISIIKLISDWLSIVRYRSFRSVYMSAILFCKHGFHKKVVLVRKSSSSIEQFKIKQVTVLLSNQNTKTIYMYINCIRIIGICNYYLWALWMHCLTILNNNQSRKRILILCKSLPLKHKYAWSAMI